MKIRLLSFLAASFLIAVPAQATRRSGITSEAFESAYTQITLMRLERSTKEFKETLARALDLNAIHGTALEDRLNQFASLLEDEVNSASKEFNEAAKSVQPSAGVVQRFSEHWGNTMMAATAINRAMIRRGLAPEAESEWESIRVDVNSVAHALRRPPLPNMTQIMSSEATPTVVAPAEITQPLEDLKARCGRFDDQIDHLRFGAMGPEQSHILRRWIDRLRNATGELLDEYKNHKVPAFQFKFEEALMLAAGVNRVLLVTPLNAGLTAEWDALTDRLNTLAAQLGYPPVTRPLSAGRRLRTDIGQKRL